MKAERNPMSSYETPSIVVVGLGYVGLPLAVQLAGRYRVAGFDLNAKRVEELSCGHDRTEEVTPERLKGVLNSLPFTSDPTDITGKDLYIGPASPGRGIPHRGPGDSRIHSQADSRL